MKKLMMTGMLVVGFSAAAMAGKVRDNCGCGIGSLAFGDQEGLVFHVLAATFNGICGNQTFGVTSGTLECDQSSVLVSNDFLKTFIGDNMDQLAQDIAVGSGDSLTALAVIMKIPNDDRGAFNVKLQNSFDVIFTTENVTAQEVADNIQSLI